MPNYIRHFHLVLILFVFISNEGSQKEENLVEENRKNARLKGEKTADKTYTKGNKDTAPLTASS